MSLTIVGENLQEKNRVGVEVQSLQVVLMKYSKEELGKGRHQTGDDGAHKERVEGAPLASGWAEPALSTVAPSLPCATVIRRVRARFFSDMFGGSRADKYQASSGTLRGAMACPMGGIETYLEDFGSKEKSKKGDLEQGELERSK